MTFTVKKIHSFLEYKILAGSKHQKTNASLKLRDILSNILKSCKEKKSRDFKLPPLHKRNYFPITIRDYVHWKTQKEHDLSCN